MVHELIIAFGAISGGLVLFAICLGLSMRFIRFQGEDMMGLAVVIPHALIALVMMIVVILAGAWWFQ